MGTYKGFLRNTTQHDGSIVVAHVIDEEVTFLSHYMKNIDTMFNRVDRISDYPASINVKHLDVFNANFHPLGAYEFKELGDKKKKRKVH